MAGAVQAVIIPIADRHLEYADRCATASSTRDSGWKSTDETKKTGYKIREAQQQKIPYMLVGRRYREAQADAVSVRSRENGDEGSVPVAALLDRFAGEVR